jgi:hypothetical protein
MTEVQIMQRGRAAFARAENSARRIIMIAAGIVDGTTHDHYGDRDVVIRHHDW